MLLVWGLTHRFCQPFDGRDFAAIGLHREMKAGFNDFAVEQHGASAAFADNAADMGASEADIFPQKMRQEQARLDVFFVQAPVNRNANGLFHSRVKVN